MRTYTVKGETAYDKRLQVATRIVEDSKGQPFSLKRVGINDQYEGNFAQDYQYLMWWIGNEPVIVGDQVIRSQIQPKFEYTINEEEKDENQDILYEDLGVFITRKEL